MSRKANKPILIPQGASATVADRIVTVTGPKGELQLTLHPVVTATVTSAGIEVSVQHPEDKTERALWGTTGALLRNMLIGVTDGFTRQLEINGVGYGFEISGSTLTVRAGFSHPVVITIPAAVQMKVEKNVLTLTSHDKQLVGQVAAEIRKIRKPEPYKGKGIKYIDEVITRKQGKQAAGAVA